MSIGGGLKLEGTTTRQLLEQRMANDEPKDYREEMDFAPPKERQSTPPPPPADKPIDGKMAKTEIQRALSLLYNLGHRLLHDDKRYKAADFSEEADGIYDLVSQHAELRVLLRLASPLAAVGAMIEKIDDTISRHKARKAQEAAAKARAQGNVPPTDPIVMVPNVENGNDRAKRAAFKV